MYQQLIAPDEPPMVRIAGLTGLAKVDGEAAIPVLEKELGSPNPDVQAAAIRLLNGTPGAAVTAIFVKRFAGLTPIGQLRVLTALGERNDAAVARPVVIEALKNPVPEVRTAAIGGARKGGGWVVRANCWRIGRPTTQGDEQAAARESLVMVHGPGVDRAISSAIASSSGKVQLELIRAAGERASPQLAEVLMKVAQGSDRAASQAAIRALRNAAGPEQAPALLAAVLKIQNANERREAGLTLASVIKRAAKPEIGPVLAAYQSAPDKQARLTLIDVMGQVSAGEALPALRAGLKDADPEIARAAILALTAWTTPDPLPDLLASGPHRSGSRRARSWRLRGYIKVIGTPSDRSPAESVALLKQAWPLAKQAAGKAGDPGCAATLPDGDRVADGRIRRGGSGCSQRGESRRRDDSRIRSAMTYETSKWLLIVAGAAGLAHAQDWAQIRTGAAGTVFFRVAIPMASFPRSVPASKRWTGSDRCAFRISKPPAGSGPRRTFPSHSPPGSRRRRSPRSRAPSETGRSSLTRFRRFPRRSLPPANCSSSPRL